VRPRGRFAGRALLIGAGDVALGILVFVATVWIRRTLHLPGTRTLLPAEKAPIDFFPWLLIVGGTVLISLFLAGTYDETAKSVRERGGLLVASALTAALLIATYFGSGRAVPRSVLLLYVPLLAFALDVWRRLADRVVPIGTRKVIVLGGGDDAQRAADSLSTGWITGYELHDRWRDLTPLRSRAAADVDGVRLPAQVQDVIFASDQPEDRAVLVSLLEHSLRQEFDLWILPGLADIVASRPLTRNLGDLPLVHVATKGAGPIALAYRRVMDLLCGTILLALSIPLLLIVSVAVMIESPGSPWIRQRRVGRNGREFGLLKIRTMGPRAEERSGPTLTTKDDERITSLGRFLRKTRLDELPQLLHVVSGKMSLIGPRPERPEFVSEYVKQFPAYRLRHVLKPGITGLAQVMGAYATRPDVKLRYDLGYLFHLNPLLDAFILLKTISTVLRGNGT
jgi:exopolysaccharide biosynthesis polyprenyl glycosylphosphotransferase